MAAQARKVEALKEHKKGLMKQLFPREGETQPRFRFPEFRDAGDWERETLDGALDQVSNGLSITQGSNNSGFRVTRIETISSGAIDLERVGYVLTTQDISAYKLNLGDILFSNINSLSHIGKSVFVDSDYDLYHGMNLLRLVAKRSKCEPKFLFYLINTSSVREFFRERANKAVNQASINQTELGKTELALPSIPEQHRIATCLSSLDALITAETQKLEAFKTHKRGLMQQLFPTPEEVGA
jgi:type I restriction enzyme S subunit